VLISLWLFLFAAQPKEFFLDGLKKLEQQSRKCVELWGRGGICKYILFFSPVACCFLYKAEDLSVPPCTHLSCFRSRTLSFNMTIPKLVPFDTLLVCLWLMCKFNEEVADLIRLVLFDV
jgi:hypothetical protein